ncbi:MAG: Flp pilus assembly protein CpaB [Candidatus Omnitrophica bacterium]|nr:Flp pilus assembly protein CpaB [Candidatus Omnitrophota bacterium]MCB9747084.1 Flp pilus assembly protein CpaB [Candidatus Omnitrophota bacterium]
MALNLNLENKKQVAVIVSAIALGILVSILTGNYISGEIQKQTQDIARQYEKKNSGMANELGIIKNELKKAIEAQQALARKTEQLEKRPVVVASSKGASGTGAGEDKNAGVSTAVFSEVTPPGKRAVTLEIDSLSAVGGLINPGDFVDVLGNLNIPSPDDDEGNKEVTSVLFQNIQVLAVNSNFSPMGNSMIYDAQNKAKKLNITLAVAPEEVGLLTFAQANGKLQLSLRSPVEQGRQLMQVASWESLADYVLETQGTKITIPRAKTKISESSSGDDNDEVKPFIQIFRAGEEL